MSFSISKVVKYPKSTLQNFTNTNEFGQEEEYQTLGGVLLDTNFSWLAKGPCLEVRNNKTGCKVGAWTFGYILKDSSTKVVCVDEIKKPHGHLPLLAVGLDCTISGGLICIFDVYGSKVIRTIQVKDKITSLHVVDDGFDDLNLRGPLRNFDGILAVGTVHGNVFLVDICKQICEEALQKIDSLVRDELYPCQLLTLTPKDITNIEYYMESSVREENHLAVHLNVVTDSKTAHFTLRGQKGEDRIHVNKEEVTASALFYCPQLTSLLVGYNFGAFQLWNLSDMTLVYTSPVCEEHMPISHFSIQEPDNDPRAFCYIWVAYSAIDLYQSGLPFAVMYSFCYESKDYQEGYGYLYQDFQYCGVRFQVELSAVDDTKTGPKLKGGYCIGLQSNQLKQKPNTTSNYGDDSEDSLTLCTICWTVWFSNRETQTNMLVFDLNQWYKEQMPNVPKLNACSNYMTKTNLTNILKLTVYKGGTIISARMDKKSLRQFIGTQRLEEHFYPTSLSYDVLCLRERDVAHIRNQGLQKALLGQIESAGPLCLLKPSEVYQQILVYGLSPMFVDITLSSPVSTDIQRQTVLNVGLEQQMVGWLCRCAKEWSNGSFSSAGCSLDGLINWAFQRAVLLKSNCDKYCIPLFDYSQAKLDSNTCTLLNNCTRQINNLCTFYSYLINKLPSFLSNLEIVSEQYRCLQTVSVYFEVLQWLVNIGLLPECLSSSYPSSDDAEKMRVPYPVQKLTDIYNEKRVLMQEISEGSFASSDSLLYIDNLIIHKCGAERLQKYWQQDGGSGLYPPPSLQSLLRTYLIEGPDISHKHSLVIYVFLDLATILERERYDPARKHLIKFPAVFKVSPSIIKITQAFWQLDHGHYTAAMEQLLDPFVLSDDLQNWHHAVVLRTLLLQHQHHLALLYMQVRKPSILNEKDVLTAISLFIANNMLDEAFYFQKQHQSSNEGNLLRHLFNECNKNQTLKALLYKCLDNLEEKAFFNYLQTIRDPSMDDLQVFYFLLRSRFVEAFDIHQNSKRMKPECQGLIGQRNSTRTDNIVRLFKNLLPDVNKSLVDIIRKERTNLWKEVERPTPLSVFVHNANEQIQYKSTVIHAALAKAKQTFNETANSTVYHDLTTEETPFLRTPKATPSYARRATHIITPLIIDDDYEPSPPKKIRLSPRVCSATPSKIISPAIQREMCTPIVKRKISDVQRLSDKYSTCTPQSILKVRHIVKNDETFIDQCRADLSRSVLGPSPRQPLSRTPIVRFDDAGYSFSFSDGVNDSLSLDNSSFREKVSGDNLRDHSIPQKTCSSKDSSSEVFYSPDASMNDSSKSEETKSMEKISKVDDDSQMEETKKENVPASEENEVTALQESLRVASSPKGRKSYKRPLRDFSPVRSSPRLRNLEQPSTLVKQMPNISVTSPVSEKNEETTESPSLPRLSKVRGRRSLTRQVLENNASKLLPVTDVVSLRRSITKEISYSKEETSSVTRETLDSTEINISESKIKSHEKTISSPVTPKSGRTYEKRSSSITKRIIETPAHGSDSESSDLTEVHTSFDFKNRYDGPTLSDSLQNYFDNNFSKCEDTESGENISKIDDDVQLAETEKEKDSLRVFSSPKGRKNYQRPFRGFSPVNSSSRPSNSFLEQPSTLVPNISAVLPISQENEEITGSPYLDKSRPQRRQHLEKNESEIILDTHVVNLITSIPKEIFGSNKETSTVTRKTKDSTEIITSDPKIDSHEISSSLTKHSTEGSDSNSSSDVSYVGLSFEVTSAYDGPTLSGSFVEPFTKVTGKSGNENEENCSLDTINKDSVIKSTEQVKTDSLCEKLQTEEIVQTVNNDNESKTASHGESIEEPMDVDCDFNIYDDIDDEITVAHDDLSDVEYPQMNEELSSVSPHNAGLVNIFEEDTQPLNDEDNVDTSVQKSHIAPKNILHESTIPSKENCFEYEDYDKDFPHKSSADDAGECEIIEIGSSSSNSSSHKSSESITDSSRSSEDYSNDEDQLNVSFMKNINDPSESSSDYLKADENFDTTDNDSVSSYQKLDKEDCTNIDDTSGFPVKASSEENVQTVTVSPSLQDNLTKLEDSDVKKEESSSENVLNDAQLIEDNQSNDKNLITDVVIKVDQGTNTTKHNTIILDVFQETINTNKDGMSKNVDVSVKSIGDDTIKTDTANPEEAVVSINQIAETSVKQISYKESSLKEFKDAQISTKDIKTDKQPEVIGVLESKNKASSKQLIENLENNIQDDSTTSPTSSSKETATNITEISNNENKSEVTNITEEMVDDNEGSSNKYVNKNREDKTMKSETSVITEDKTPKKIDAPNQEESIIQEQPKKNVITVTAQVHTPSNSTSKSISIGSNSSRRITRRSSLLSTTVEPDVLDTSVSNMEMTKNNGSSEDDLAEFSFDQTLRKGCVTDIFDSSLLNDSDKVLPGRRSDQTKTPLRKSLRRLSHNSIHMESDDSTNKTSSKRNLRTRSTSVDQTLESESRKRSLRSASVDNRFEKREGSNDNANSDVSTIQLPSHESETNSKSSKQITRGIPQIENIDPIKLLDKPPFEGIPDPEEAKVYEISPTAKPVRRLRSASVASEPVTPRTIDKTRRRISADHADSPIPTSIKFRLRRTSTESANSEKSIPSPPKRTRKNSGDKMSSQDSDAGSVRSTRSRSASVASMRSETEISLRRSTRVRKVVSARSQLPEISEEQPSENVNTNEKQTKKRGRKN